jgi:hypothetical protein
LFATIANIDPIGKSNLAEAVGCRRRASIATKVAKKVGHSVLMTERKIGFLRFIV